MRIRSIKPEFWRSSDISNLSVEDRFLFIGLWSYVDDNGVGLDKLSSIVADLFADDLMNNPRETVARVSRGLQHLSEAGRIVRYTLDEVDYLSVTNWTKHQRIDRPNKPRFPQYSADSAQIRDTLASVATKGASGTGEQGNRGTEEQGSKTPSSPATPSMDSAPDFSAWYEHYPRKVGKQAAEKAYLKARKTVTAAQLLLAVRRYAADPNLPEQQFIPHPSKWLNDGRWDDGPLPVRRDTARPGIDDKVRAGMTLAQQLQAEEQAAENQKQIGA